MRRLLSLALTLVIVFSLAGFARASPNSPGVTEIVQKHAESSGSMLARIIANPIESLATSLLTISGFQSIDKLVFNPDGGGFTDSEWDNIVKPWYTASYMLALSKGVISLIVVVFGYGQLFGSFGSPAKAAQAREKVASVLIALLLVACVPNLLAILLELNKAVVQSIMNYAGSQGIGFGDVIGDQFMASINKEVGNLLLRALIKLALAGLTLYLNFIYMVRKFMLIVLVITMPLIAWSWVSSKTKTPIKIALSELITNALMPASHALVLVLYMTIVQFDGQGIFNTWWAKLFAITLVVPLGAFLRNLVAGWLNLLGFQEESLAQHGTSGLATLMAIGDAIIAPTASGSKRPTNSRLPTKTGSSGRPDNQSKAGGDNRGTPSAPKLPPGVKSTPGTGKGGRSGAVVPPTVIPPNVQGATAGKGQTKPGATTLPPGVPAPKTTSPQSQKDDAMKASAQVEGQARAKSIHPGHKTQQGTTQASKETVPPQKAQEAQKRKTTLGARATGLAGKTLDKRQLYRSRHGCQLWTGNTREQCWGHGEERKPVGSRDIK